MHNYPSYLELFKCKIIPVVVLDDPELGADVAYALIEGRIDTIEVTLRTPNALKVIDKIAHKVSGITVGAGTVLNEDDYDMAINHGAKFIVSPGLSSQLVDASHKYDAPFIPGAVTPSEIIFALENGLSHLKFFPAQNYGGIATLKSLASVFAKVKFCPTGGINGDNFKEYLDLPNVVAVGTSTICAESILIQGNFAAQITQNCRNFINKL